ncbi:MAG TPA: NBR1-Ig-like domain-containing protein, partial [Aggregatilineales bacterium]|nr:NBR1-Ig-like domain-containing protein [Aggregatilineales bacterium]
RPALTASANLDLRKEPSRSGQVLRRLQGGTPLRLIRWDDNREWLAVSTADGEQGFVAAEFVLEPDGISLAEQLRRWSPRAGRTPAVQFIADVTIPDGEAIGAGQRFTKVWRVRNTGDRAFAEGTVLAFTGGDPLGARSLTLPINEPLYPDKDTDVAVELAAPEKPGRVRSVWELRDRSGQAISLELYVEIEVVLMK